MKTIIGLLPDGEHATHAQQALHAGGVPASTVTLLTRPGEVWNQLGGPAKMAVVFRTAGMGALFGFGIGLLYGLPAGIMNCSQLSCPFTTSAALLALITIFWVLGGALLGAIIGIDRLEQGLYSYVEGVRHGQTLLVVTAPDKQADDVIRVLRHENGGLVRSYERSR